MKKRLFTSLLALLMLLPLLAIAPTAGADAPPETYTIWCRTCEQNTTGRFDKYSASGSFHYPMYRCTVCLEYYTSAPFYEDCSGGTATCTKRATCSVCHYEYGSLRSHDWAFSANNDQTHVRTCQYDDCGYIETVPCTLDSANCARGAQCSGCKAIYGDIDPNNHVWGYWTCNGDMTHSRICNLNASHTETGSCSLRVPDCTSPRTCRICHGWYGDIDPNNHPFHSIRSNGNGTHTIKCDHNASTTHDTIEKCYGDSSATCLQEGTCSACGGKYYADHVFTKWTIWSDRHEQRCDVCYDRYAVARDTGPHYDDNRDHQCDACGMEMSKCSFEAHAEEKYLASPADCVTKARYYLHCNYCGQMSTSTFEGEVDPDNHDLEHHEGKEPTCTETGWEAYDTCSRCDYTTYEELPANSGNHDLSHVKAKAPTCTDHGWEAYDVCKRCGYNTIKELPALGHWYGEWAPNGSHTHLASCKRGCGHRAATTCAALDYALLTEGADAYEFTLCPVCGEVSDGALLKLIDQTTAQPLTRWLPAGEQVLRLGTLENGGILLTAAFEISGQLTQPTGIVQFTLPAEHLERMTLTILHPNGTEEPLPYTVAGKTATFTLDFTDQKVPAMTLHLIPET